MKIKFKKALSVLLSLTMILTFCSCGSDEPHPENEIIEFRLTSEPLTLDPQIAADNASIMLVRNLFEGLTRENAEGEIVAGAAESWDISDDGKSYTFHLYDGMKWSNGQPLTAEDFVFGITRALDPETRSESAADLYMIKGANAFASGSGDKSGLGLKALDDKTVEITLEYPSDNLLKVLTLPAAMPCSEEFFSQSRGKYGKEPELLITDGPFCIREPYGWDHNKYIYIRRSENYAGANKALPLGVNFTIGETPADPVSEIISGSVDICEIYGNMLERAKENELPITTTSNTLWGVCYNTDIKAFKNAKLRVALFGSLDRASLLDDVPESYVKTSQLIPDNVSFGGKKYRAFAGDIKLDKAQDPTQMFEKAKAELDEKEIELRSSYTIICLNDDTSSKIVTQLITKWNEVTGCYFNKEMLTRGELEQRIDSGDYEIALAPLNTSVDSPMEFLSSFKSRSSNNFINLNYPQYDQFIETALSSGDVDKTIDALKKAESYLIEYGYLYPLYYESRYFASAAFISGAVFDTTSDTIDFTNVKKLREN